MADRTPVNFAPVQKWLHWTMAALIVVMACVGLTMTRIGEGPVTNFLYELRKSTGLVVLTLAVIRVAVRLSHGAPEIEPGVPAWQRTAAYATHYALYGLMLLVPLAGWTATSSCCPPVNLFWTVPLTLPVPGEEAFSHRVFQVHFALAYTLIAIVLLHVSGALQHHLIRRDKTLIRMLPGGRSARSDGTT